MNLGLEQSLSTLVKARYNDAKAAQSLIFSETELAILKTHSGIPFRLRYCPALSKKPKANDTQSKPDPKPDPFENPPKDLLIAEIPRQNPSHILVLNKYPIIPSHFILATKTNKPQTHLLEEDDLALTHAILQAWSDNNPSRRLFAFFNSGPHSGASQPHRHVQFVPVEEMRPKPSSFSTPPASSTSSPSPESEWQPLLDQILHSGIAHPRPPNSDPDLNPNHSSSPTTNKDLRPLSLPSLPFWHLTAPVPSFPSPASIHAIYTSLYEAALSHTQSHLSEIGTSLPVPADENEVSLSYNLAMTTEGMGIVPRLSEGLMLRDEDGEEVGRVALNGTVLAGTLMVKGAREWDLLRGEGEGGTGLDEVLAAIGVPV